MDGGLGVQVPVEALIGRIDHVLGIHKFWGPGSYPVDQGLVSGMSPDFLCLILILIVKHYLVKVGRWHYVGLNGSLYETPSFKSDPDEREPDAKYIRYIKELNEARNFGQRVLIISKRGLKLLKNFILRLLPIYMKPQ